MLLATAGMSLGVLASAGGAWAQQAQPAAAPAPPASGKTDKSKDKSKKDENASVQEVVVTATGTNIAGIAPVGSESIAITRSQALDTGVTTVDDLISKMPQVSELSSPNGALREGGTSGYGTPAGGGANTVSGTAVNLRGIGAQATLTLVDGHRLAMSGTASTFTDANQIPLAALQTVEIIADGNSAIYGSDAIGGVVNYVTRKDFNGIQVGARSTFVDGYDEYGADIVVGRTWENLGHLGGGNFILAYDYDYREAMPMTTHPYLENDLTQYGGYDRRILGTDGAVNGGVGPNQTNNEATPGALTSINYCSQWVGVLSACNPFGSASYVYFSAPAGAGLGLTGADLSTTPSLEDVANYTDYLGEMQRHQVTAFYNQDLTPWLSLYAEELFTKRTVITRGSEYSEFNPTITINPGDIYYIAPPAAPAGYSYGGPEYVDYNFYAHGAPNWTTSNPDDMSTTIVGLKAKLWGDWGGDLSFDYGIDHACGICQLNDNIDIGAFQHEVDIGAINPYSSAPLTASQLEAIEGSNIQYSHMIIEDGVLKLNGTLFSLPGGDVKAAFGGEIYYNEEHLQNGANRSPGEQGAYAPVPNGYNIFIWDNNTSLSRTIASAFGELFIPVIGDANQLPLVKSFAIDAAARFDHYSDVGDTTNPKIAVTWKLTDDFKLRASWGTSFRAPALTDVNPFVFSAKVAVPGFVNLSGNPAYGPMFGDNVGFVIGSQAGIKPETARNWSTGFDYNPDWFSGFTLSATYYNIDYTNQIASPAVFPNALLSPAFAAEYAAYIHPIPANPGCTGPSNYNAEQQAFANAIGIYGNPTPAQICSMNVWLDGRETNSASTTESGLDMTANYRFRVGEDLINLNATATRVMTEKLEQVAGAPILNVLGTIGYMVPWRGRGDVTWAHGPVVANVYMNYVGSYLNNTPTPGTPNTNVSAWITFDASLTFNFNKISDSYWAKGLRTEISAQNLFDRAPPLVLTAGYAAFDAAQANPFGRMVTLQVTKDF
jgi:iron complex outermembrane receptor protein